MHATNSKLSAEKLKNSVEYVNVLYWKKVLKDWLSLKLLHFTLATRVLFWTQSEKMYQFTISIRYFICDTFIQPINCQ